MATKTKKKVVASPRLPGPNARAVNLQGKEESLIYDSERVFVYIEPRPEGERFEKRQREHPITGKPMFHPAPEGRMPRPVMYLEEILPLYVDEGTPGSFAEHDTNGRATGKYINPPAWREYVVDQGGNGTNTKNFWFRPDPEVQARQERERKAKARLDAILQKLSESDDDDAVVAEIQAKRKPGRPPKTAA